MGGGRPLGKGSSHLYAGSYNAYIKIWAKQNGEVCEVVALTHNASVGKVHSSTPFL